MTDRQYRAELDAEVSFTNGGRLSAEGFRIDLPSETPTDDVRTLFLTSLGLLMVDQVELRQVRVFEESHKGTRGGPSDPAAVGTGDSDTRWVELSHVISAGMITYPGLPGPEVAPHLTREASRQVYAPGTEFAIDRISMLGNTGTYLDSPFHRYAAGTDLAGVALSALADLPAVVVRTVGAQSRGVDIDALAALDVEGRAVLLHTGGDRHWGTPDYLRDAPYLTGAGAGWLVDHGVVLVGIDAVNIDDTGDGARPAHTVLLGAGIPIVEHLTGLDQLPPYGARFTAAPPRVANFGTFPVRAYAAVPTVPT
jgi:arylformamidase